MVKKWHMISVALFALSTVLFFEIHSCMITFINDSHNTIMLNDKNDQTIFYIKKNGRRRFGNQNQFALFDVYVKQAQSESYRALYFCEQRSCSKNNSVQVKFTDLHNDSADPELLLVKKNSAPVTSMVQGLPMINSKK